MNIKIFNYGIALGWLLATAGAMVLSVGAGLCVGGVLMLALTFVLARIGGIYGADKDKA